MTPLELQGLDVTIAGQSVCRGLDLRIQAGQCWGLLGRNGVGKTTLLHTVAGLRSADRGTIRLHDMPVTQLSRRRIARLAAVLFQEHQDVFPSTVLETVLIGRHPHLGLWQWEGAADMAIARRTLQALGIADLEDRSLATLSGGERRRVEIAALLAQDPGLLVLDEPTNHLDLHHQIEVLDSLTRHCRDNGKAMLMSMHDINLATRYCDHVLMLFGDGEAGYGEKDDMLTEQHLTRLYQHPIHRVAGAAGPVYMPG